MAGVVEPENTAELGMHTFMSNISRQSFALPVFFVWLACSFFVDPVITGAEDRPMPATCSYEVSTWNVNQKRSVDLKFVRHPYHSLSSEEIDTSTGCTVCQEDQQLINIPPFPAFFVCHIIASRIQTVFEELKRNNAPIFSVVGYHVIKSRGVVDQSGNRTGFSNHSFGTAIDINSDQNGLYDRCREFGPDCRLLRGGERREGVPGTLEDNGEIVRAMKTAGFLWGGEIAGNQKDFMHFSLTGY
jgi:hypothetical protein